MTKIQSPRYMPSVAPNVPAVSVSPDAFGAAQARALGSVATGLDVWAARFKEMELERDDAEVLQAVQKMKQDFFAFHNDPKNGIFNVRLGLDAANVANESNEYMAAYIENELPNLRNDNQRRVFQKTAFGVQNGFLDDSAKFEARQHKAGIDAIAKTSIDNTISDSAASPLNADLFNSNFDIAGSAIRQLLKGQDESVISAAIAEHRGKMIHAQISALLTLDPKTAISLWGQIREEVPGSIRTAIDMEVNKESESRDIYSKVDQYWGANGTNYESVYRSIENDSSLDYEQKNKVWALYKAKYNTEQRFIKEREIAEFNRVRDAIWNSSTPEEAERIIQASGADGFRRAQYAGMAAQKFKPEEFKESIFDYISAKNAIFNGVYVNPDDFVKNYEGLLKDSTLKTFINAFYEKDSNGKHEAVGPYWNSHVKDVLKDLGIDKDIVKSSIFLDVLKEELDNKRAEKGRALTESERANVLVDLNRHRILKEGIIWDDTVPESEARFAENLGLKYYPNLQKYVYEDSEGNRYEFDPYYKRPKKSDVNDIPDFVKPLDSKDYDKDYTSVQAMVSGGGTPVKGGGWNAARKNSDGTDRGAHKAVDIPAKPGSVIRSSDFGSPLTVRKVAKGDREGNYIYMDGLLPGGRKIEVWVMHMEDGIPLKINDIVNADDVLGQVGKNPGSTSTGPHMHLQIKINGQFVHPEKHLKEVKAKIEKS